MDTLDNSKTYEYIAFDAQYYLMRNLMALKGRCKVSMPAYLEDGEGDTTIGYVIDKYNFDAMELVKRFFWTIVKEIRDYNSCEKVILLWDKAPYYRTKDLPDYKGSRVHLTQELIDEYDIASDPAGYLQMKEDYKLEMIKSEAKYWIINNLHKFGMPSVILSGYEADDLACIFSDIIKKKNTGRKSAICSIDSDWMYWINDKVDFIKGPLSGGDYEVWTEEDVNLECEGKCQQLDMSLFQLKQFMDSTFYSHNDLQPVSTLGWKDIDQLYSEIESGDFTHITDVDRYLLNMKSFEYWNFPNFEDAKQAVDYAVRSGGSKFDMAEFEALKKLGFTVSESYSKNYIQLLNQNYYGE